MFYTAIWIGEDKKLQNVTERSFRDAIPLELLGESMKRFGGKERLQVLTLEGYERLEAAFLNRLRELGMDVIDAGKTYRSVLARFPNIAAAYNRYQRNCFLRWLVIKEISERDGATQCWHLDSDIVLHASLDEIAEDTRGKTFILQGCPAFTSIADRSWFERYEDELKKLETDIVGYCRTAAKEKTECLANDAKLDNISMYRTPFGHDQDFLEYLVSAKKIPQNTAVSTRSNKFFYIENPLVIQWWTAREPEASAETNVRENTNGSLWLGKRRIPFIHYQGTFCFYANLFLAFGKIGADRLPSFEKLMRFDINGSGFRVSPAAQNFWRIARRLGQEYGRERIVRALMQHSRRTGNSNLVDVLSLISRNMNKVQI